MQDVIYVIITVAFFALAAGFVRICDRIIGPDPTPTDASETAPTPLERVDVDDADAAAVAAGSVR